MRDSEHREGHSGRMALDKRSDIAVPRSANQVALRQNSTLAVRMLRNMLS
jgi:hypothetical protein